MTTKEMINVSISLTKEIRRLHKEKFDTVQEYLKIINEKQTLNTPGLHNTAKNGYGRFYMPRFLFLGLHNTVHGRVRG